jgi:hypothetical protein
VPKALGVGKVLTVLGRYQFAALLALVTLATRGSGLALSFYSGDEATYSALARRILAGALPYVSAVDHKPVGIEMLYASVYALPGHLGLHAVRALFLVIVWLTALLLAEIAARLSPGDLDANERRAIGRTAALAYVLVSAWGFASDVQAANTELLLNLPLALAALLCLRTVRGEAPFFGAALAGALVGLAGLCKYQSALVGGGFAAFVFLTAPRAITWRALPGLAIGFAAVAVGYVGAFVLGGYWDAFSYWGWRFNFSYMSILTTREIVENGLKYTGWIALVWAPLWLAGLRSRRWPAGTAPFVVTWVTAAAFAVSAGGRFFPHYYLIALPPLVIACAPGVHALLAGNARRGRVLGGLAALATVASLVMAWGWYALKPAARANASTYAAVASYVREHSVPDDRLLVWGNSPEIYELADRRMGTRFPFCNYHTGLIWGTPLYDEGAPGAEAHIVPRAWTELLADLRAAPPAFIVDAASGGLDHFAGHGIDRYAPLSEFVHEHYAPVSVVARVPVWQRR